MELDIISKMKVEELKDFLRLRGLKVSGRKEELIARVFVAAENEVPIVKTAEEVQAEIAKEYQSKLSIENELLPDPCTLVDGWLSEDESVKLWPMTLYPDIFNFLAFHPSELKSKDLSDYKMSKAYSYYSTGWLNPMSFHPVKDSSQFCFLKSTCRPSQRITDIPHKLWVCLSKKSGQIMKAHCSCMAGISQTCNHVAAALFRIEAAVRMGLTNPACTTTACEWLPKSKLVKMVKIKDLKLSRNTFGSQGKKPAELNCSPKKRFNAVKHMETKLSFEDVANALHQVCNDAESILFTAEYKEKKMDNEPISGEEKICTLDDFITKSKSQEEFCYNLEYFPDQVAKIEKDTRGQAITPLWFSVRKHMISASKAHDIKTRMETFGKGKLKGIDVDMKTVIDKIAGRIKVNPMLPALKYGQAMESNAVQAFTQIYKESHTNVVVEECGIFLCQDMPFVGGSPDRIISCDCCGKSCLEVKCPSSISHLSPIDADVKLPYLKKERELTVSLNRNHKYFTQCQVQMAAAKLRKCYFFVWTTHGNFVEKLEFDEKLWRNLKDQFLDFYLNHYLPSFFT